MNEVQQVGELEAALLARAENLAAEYRERGHSSAERIAAEAQERLRLREEKEVLAAKAEAERLHERQVQAAEIRLQGELDRLRWTLVSATLSGLDGQLDALVKDVARYRGVLQDLLRQGVEALVSDGREEVELVAQLTERDRRRFAADWDALVAEAVPDHEVALDEEPAPGSGGVLVRTADNRVRVDNTFEGRRERLAESLQEEALERLFAPAMLAGWVEHG